MISYQFSTQKPKFFHTRFKNAFKLLVLKILSITNYKLKRIHYNFCTDEEILILNRQSLNHDFYTDILTFNYSNTEYLEVEIYISLDRVKDNANFYDVTLESELLRVMVHGILHCVGYNDETDQESILMREKEDYYINEFFNLLNVPRGTSA
jgi:rRNA maturation RNase YbeY